MEKPRVKDHCDTTGSIGGEQPNQQCAVNIIFTMNPKHSTVSATKLKTTSAETRTDMLDISEEMLCSVRHLWILQGQEQLGPCDYKKPVEA